MKDDVIKRLNNSDYIYYKQNEVKPNACIIIKRDINAFLCSNYSTAVNTVIRVEQEGGYLQDMQPVSLVGLTEENRRTNILIGRDANARKHQHKRQG